MMYRNDDEQLRIAHSKEATTYLSRPLTHERLSDAFQFFDVTLNALSHTVYSKPYLKSNPSMTRNILQVKPGRPVVFVPLASADERFALKLIDLPSLNQTGELFKDQNDWLNYVLDLAKNYSEWEFVIRPHPRMFPNHREKNTANELHKLLELLSLGSANVHINLPSDNLSLPEILQITDVVLGGTTSAGLEALAYGLPVVTHNERLLFAYPAQLGKYARTKEEYVTHIRKSIDSNWSIENVRQAMRWMVFLDTVVSRKLTKGNSSENSTQLVWRSRFQTKIFRRLKLFQRLPRAISLPLAVTTQILSIRNSRRHDGHFSSEAQVFHETLTSQLPGLHRVSQLVDSDEVIETSALYVLLNNLLKKLGTFEDPTCLSSRIESFLSRESN